MKVTHNGTRFEAKCSFENREIPKSAKFRWDQGEKVWYTFDANCAAQLRSFCDDKAKKEIDRLFIQVEPWLSGVSWPPHLTPFDFQIKAAEFILSRNRCYAALDAGLGKTIVAAMVAQTEGWLRSVYVTPPFLVTNVIAEFHKWAPDLIVAPFAEIESCPDVLIVPDSILHKLNVIDQLKDFVGNRPARLFVDEAHRFKNYKAKRTKVCFKTLTNWFSRVVAMSGTPSPNKRPIELWPAIEALAPEVNDFKNFFHFGKTYCEAYQGAWGWDFSGSSNERQFEEKLTAKFMLRIRKQDVLKELPPKIEELVILNGKLSPIAVGLEKELLKTFSPSKPYKEAADGPIASYRRDVGLTKIPFAAEFIRNFLDDNSDDSLIVFAVHQDVIAGLANGLSEYRPLVITGKTPVDERQELVSQFQIGKSRLFIGNIQAAGVGFTMTKASRVVFVEYSWTPADNDQAADRAHRIGQRDVVYVQYLVLPNSIDNMVAATFIEKQQRFETL